VDRDGDHRRVGEREGPPARAEGHPPVDRGEAELHQDHEDGVSRQAQGDRVRAAAVDGEPRGARDDGRGHLDGDGRHQGRGQRRLGEQPQQDDRAEDEPADGAVAEHQAGQGVVPEGGAARGPDEPTGHGRQEVAGVPLRQREVRHDPPADQPAAEQEGRHERREEDDLTGVVRVPGEGRPEQHGHDDGQRGERPERRIDQVAAQPARRDGVAHVGHQQPGPDQGGQRRQRVGRPCRGGVLRGGE
jgi:hypothetical protein